MIRVVIIVGIWIHLIVVLIEAFFPNAILKLIIFVFLTVELSFQLFFLS